MIEKNIGRQAKKENGKKRKKVEKREIKGGEKEADETKHKKRERGGRETDKR